MEIWKERKTCYNHNWKKIVWKLFNMNWTFIYLKIVWYDIKWDSLRGEFLFFESKRDSSTPKVWESSTPQTWESSTPWIWEYHTPLFELDNSAILDATSARGCGTPLLSNWYVVQGLTRGCINQVHKNWLSVTLMKPHTHKIALICNTWTLSL